MASRKSPRRPNAAKPGKTRFGKERSAGRKAAAVENPAGHFPSPVAPAGVRPPLAGHGKRGESGYLGYLLRQAQAAARLAMERTLADLGVTPPQFVVLTMLKAYPGLSGADLARVALLTPQTVGVIIRNLERDGAIRKAPHPVHGRILMWTLTRKGLALLQRCRHLILKVERRLAAGLSARDQTAVRRWLARIAVNL